MISPKKLAYIILGKGNGNFVLSREKRTSKEMI
jgi:hypothetical protein